MLISTVEGGEGKKKDNYEQVREEGEEWGKEEEERGWGGGRKEEGNEWGGRRNNKLKDGVVREGGLKERDKRRRKNVIKRSESLKTSQVILISTHTLQQHVLYSSVQQLVLYISVRQHVLYSSVQYTTALTHNTPTIITLAQPSATPLFHTHRSGVPLGLGCRPRPPLSSSGGVWGRSAGRRAWCDRPCQCPSTQINYGVSFEHNVRTPSSVSTCVCRYDDCV